MIVSVALVISPLELSIVLNETALRFNNNIVVPTFTILNKVDGDDIEVLLPQPSNSVHSYNTNKIKAEDNPLHCINPR